MLRCPYRALCGVMLAGLFVAPGCESGSEQSGRPKTGLQTAAAPDSAAVAIRTDHPPSQPAGRAGRPSAAMAPPSAVALRLADRQVYEEVLTRHKGRPVLVDFWATWCLSCTEQFPHTVGLHAKYAAAGLAVVSVSLDEPANEAEVRAFLEKQRATFDNLLSKWGGDDPSFENFGIRAGTIPCYQLYDRDGQLRETFSVDPAAARQFTPADIEQSVVRLLRLTAS